MNIQLLAADIASRVPEMAKDSASNNAELIEGILKPVFAELETCETHVKILQELARVRQRHIEGLLNPTPAPSPQSPEPAEPSNPVPSGTGV